MLHKANISDLVMHDGVGVKSFNLIGSYVSHMSALSVGVA